MHWILKYERKNGVGEHAKMLPPTGGTESFTGTGRSPEEQAGQQGGGGAGIKNSVCDT